MKKKLNNRTSALRALSGKNWDPTSTNDLKRVYNTYSRPGGLYSAEIWTPFLSHSNWETLETSNNRASRIITRTLSSTPSAVSKLDARTPSYKIPVKDNAAHLLESYRRFPEMCHLNQLCQQTIKPRLRSRGENNKRPDWR